MKFSIVIPVYERAATVLATLQSVAAQTYGDYECLVVDDGSSDGALLEQVVRDMRDDRFRYLRQENAGGCVARNTGIDAAVGEWVALLDSDDYFAPEKLEVVARAVHADPGVGLVYHPAVVDRGKGRTAVRPSRGLRPDETVAQFTFRGREFIQTSTLVLRTDLARKVRFDPALKKAQDIDFLMRVQQVDGRFLYIDELLSVWNDAATTGRVGAPRRPDTVIAWFAKVHDLFDPVTERAFRSTYLSYEIARTRPISALSAIAGGALTGAVSPRASVQALLRAFLPQAAYRRLVDGVLSLRGNGKATTPV